MGVRKPKASDYKGSRKWEAIENDLLQQIADRGTACETINDLVGDYMSLWVTKCMLVEDIQSRGITVRYNNGGGQSGTRKNESVDMLLKTNAQMLRLLAELGLRPAQTDGEPGDL